MNEKTNLTGIILAGGKSSRLGTDKALLKIDNKLFIEQIRDIIAPFTTEIIISSNNPNHKLINTHLLPDVYPNKGPLSGIYSGLANALNQNCLIVSCDRPQITAQFIQVLWNKHITTKKQISICEINNFPEPLIGIYNKSVTELLNQELENNRTSVIKFIYKTNYQLLNKSEFTENINWLNINTISDYNALIAKK